MKLIINADDLGQTIEQNIAIEKALYKGVISSSTIMGGAKYFADGVEIARKHPEASFGVHLHLDGADSLTKNDVFLKHGMITTSGEFVKGCMKGDFKFTPELLDAIYTEFDMQISRIEDAGITITHIDGHHFVHTFSPLLDIILKLMQRHNIKGLRLMQYKTLRKLINQLCKDIKSVSVREISSFISQHHWVHRVKKSCVTTDWFCEASYFINNEHDFDSMDGVIELMTHPGHPMYEEETRAIYKFKGRYELITYADLIQQYSN